MSHLRIELKFFLPKSNRNVCFFKKNNEKIFDRRRLSAAGASVYHVIFIGYIFKETKSATMSIFRFFFYFLLKSFVKIEISYVFTINLFTIVENCTERELSYKTGVFSLVGNYLRPSNNNRQLVLT